VAAPKRFFKAVKQNTENGNHKSYGIFACGLPVLSFGNFDLQTRSTAQSKAIKR